MKKLIKQNPYITSALFAALSIAAFFGGCQITAPSLLDPNVRVNRLELENELQTLLDLAELRFRQMNNEETMRRELLNHALLIGQSGQVNLLGLIPLAASILGAGAVADNVRKRKKYRNGANSNVENDDPDNSPPGRTTPTD